MKRAGKGWIITATLILQMLLQGFLALGYSLAMWDDTGDLVSDLVFKHVVFSAILLIMSATAFFFAKTLSLIITLGCEAVMCGVTATLARSDYRWLNPEHSAFAWDHTPMAVAKVFDILNYACFGLMVIILVVWLFDKLTKSKIWGHRPQTP